MSLTTEQATAECSRLRRWRVERVHEIFSEGPPDALSGDLALALFSRETNCRNVIGGGYFDERHITPTNPKGWVTTGVDRGLGQINEQYHEAWLRSTKGCDSGSYEEAYDSALPAGRVPGLTATCKKVRSILRYNVTYAISRGVLESDVVKVALAGYNGGIGRAITAYEHGVDPDVVTTGADYGADVLARRATFRRARKAMGWHTP